MTTEALFRQDAYLRQCEARITHIDETGIRLDRTVFYPLGGGQAGDAGELVLVDGTRLAIADTRKSKHEGATPTMRSMCPARASTMCWRDSRSAISCRRRSTGRDAFVICAFTRRRI